MTELQLSEEMEKRFDKEFGYLSVAIDYYVENAYPLRKESGMKHLKDIKHFLATALEEQRQELLSEVESWLVDDAPVTDKAIINVYDDKTVIEIFELHRVVANRLRAELRAKLVEMKEGNEKYL